MSKKIVAVIFGGKSGEHEVSLVSAASVLREIPRDKYEAVEVGIDKEGRWYRGEGVMSALTAGSVDGLEAVSFEKALEGCDIAFPVLHGPFGEDGTIQGLFEMLGMAYVGCGVLASSACMDKIICKDVLAQAGVPVVPYVSFLRSEWETGSDKWIARVDKEIDYPCFVKPSNMGSSVGITKVADSNGIKEAIDLACKFDSRILVEKAVNAREIECAVLGNDEPEAAELGEILVGGEFYDYNDKYVDGKSSTQVPVEDLNDDKKSEIGDLCVRAYKAMDCSGLSRVDCFLDRDSGDIYLNEINTLPGFTSISMYPKMWQASGVTYPELIDRLIQLGFQRADERSKNQISFDSGSNWFKAS
jgi:D-alanine-D-alanine ligase